jgi:hypothetical protein
MIPDARCAALKRMAEDEICQRESAATMELRHVQLAGSTARLHQLREQVEGYADVFFGA